MRRKSAGGILATATRQENQWDVTRQIPCHVTPVADQLRLIVTVAFAESGLIGTVPSASVNVPFVTL